MVALSQELKNSQVLLAIAPQDKMDIACEKLEKEAGKNSWWVVEPSSGGNGQKIVARKIGGKEKQEFLAGGGQAEMAVARILLEKQPDLILLSDVGRLVPKNGLAITRFVHYLSSRLRTQDKKAVLAFSAEDLDEDLLKDVALFCDKTIRLE